MPPSELLAALAGYVAPGEPLTLPSGLVAALREAVTAPAAVKQEEGGTGPGGDFTARDLAARYRRSASWVRARFAAGDFGRGYWNGRERFARREDVLAFDAEMRSAPAPKELGRRRGRAAGAPLSLVERRERGGKAA